MTDGMTHLPQDSTHYEKTLQLLKKYDPDFVPPAPPPMPPAPGAPRGKVGLFSASGLVEQRPGAGLGTA